MKNNLVIVTKVWSSAFYPVLVALFIRYLPEPSPESFQKGTLRLFRGAWHCEVW